MTKDHQEVFFIQDDCLIDIGDGKQINESKLRKLPPWRAVMLAVVAVRAGAMTEEAFDKLKADAIEVGGEGTLPNG